MKTNKLLLGLTLGLSLLATNIFADDPKARAIMEKVDARDDGKTIQQNMMMVLIDKNNNKRTRDIKSYGKDFGVDEHQIMFFKSPADVKNTAFLTYDYDASSRAIKIIFKNILIILLVFGVLRCLLSLCLIELFKN